MGKHVFKADLSVEGIKKLQRELEYYRTVELPNKIRELASRLADIGLKTARAKIDESPLGRYVSLQVDMEPGKTEYKAILIATGAVKESENYDPFNILLAIEFGAGIHYNPTPNPNAGEFGLGVGTFPGQVHAYQDLWFYWDEKNEKWMPTRGVKATMPMYSADMEIIQSVVKIAKEVFG